MKLGTFLIKPKMLIFLLLLKVAKMQFFVVERKAKYVVDMTLIVLYCSY